MMRLMATESTLPKKTFLSGLSFRTFGSIFLFPEEGKDPNKEKLHWIINMRYHMLVAITVLAFAGAYFNYLQPAMYPYFVAIVGFFVAITFITQYTFIRNPKAVVTQNLIFSQVLLDLIVFTSFLFITRGFENPFISVFYIHAFMGGMLLDWGIGFVFHLIVSMALGYIQYLGYDSNSMSLDVYKVTVATQQFVAFLSWIIARSLGRHLHYSHERLMKLKVAAERTDRLRAVGALTAGLSHEFASPLNTIKIRMGRLVKRLDDTKESDELLAAIEQCETVLKKMNSAQLDLRDFDYEQIDACILLDKISEIWLQDQSNLKIVKNFSVRPIMRLPGINFTQSVLNLLDNSADSMNVSGRIEINLYQAKEDFILEILDFGAGFDSEVLKRFGEPFNTTKVHGTGLGLYSVLLFMNSIGGSLQVENHDSGAVVKMIFPRSCVIEVSYER